MATVVVKITSPQTGFSNEYFLSDYTLEEAREVEEDILEETTRCLHGQSNFWRTLLVGRLSSAECAHIFFPAEVLKNNIVTVYVKE